MTLREYLRRKYGTHTFSLSAYEAKFFGIPYPLETGWMRKWGSLTITQEMAKSIIQYFSSGTKNGGRDAFKASAISALEQVTGASTKRMVDTINIEFDFVEDDSMLGEFSGQPSFRVDRDSDCRLTVRCHPEIIDDLRQRISSVDFGISLIMPTTREA
jgi:hypothetical protein